MGLNTLPMKPNVFEWPKTPTQKPNKKYENISNWLIKAYKTEIKIEENKPTRLPSKVLLGLIIGNIFFLPKSFPPMYAIMSFELIKIINKKTKVFDPSSRWINEKIVKLINQATVR